MAPPGTPPDNTTNLTTEDRRLPSYIGGIACRLPKSANVEIFWQNLIDKVDMLDRTRWPVGIYNLPPRTGTLEDVEDFDNDFFGLSIAETAGIPCMLRLLLEVIYECIIDSGIPRKTLSKSRTGLYLAINFCEDQEINRGTDSSFYINTKSEFIYRIFSILDLSGPAASVDTACCSSISAIQMANMDLYLGRCDYAIVVGANMLENLNHAIQFFKLGMLSPSGQSLPFDTKANGYVRSEGFVAMLLSSSSLLNRIYAKIDNVVCLCDGHKERGILSPSEKDQINLLKKAYLDRYPVYVEAHATGTQLGDETELKSLKEAFGDKLKEPLLIGSCKSNLGHTEACAGLVGLLKCVLSIHHGVIPPNINLMSPHPLLTESKPWAKVVTQETKLPDGYIGVSSFGFGGVIGHVVLEKLPEKITNIPKYVLVPVKLKDVNHSNKIIRYVDENTSRTDTLCLMATASFCLSSEPDFIGYIKILKNDMVVDIKSRTGENRIWLVLNDILFADQSMFNEDLLEIDFVNRSFDKYQSILCSKGSDVSLSKIFSTEERERRFKDQFFLSAATLIAFLDLLMLCNFKPDGILGIGLSDIIVAYYDGCISLETCLYTLELIATYLASKIALKEASFDQRSFVIRERVDIPKRYPRATPVAVVNEFTSYINISKDDEESLKTISTSGDLHKEIFPPIPTYWQKELDETLTLQLKSILRPKERSRRWVSCLSKHGIVLQDCRQFGFNYVHHLLTHPVDLSLVKLPTESNIFLLNGDKRLGRLVLISETMKINYCHPDCSSVMSTLGNLHLLTDDIDIAKVNPDVFPLDHTTPPIGHLITWNRDFWLIPEWQHYCAPMRNQLITEYPVELYDVYAPIPILIANIVEVLRELMCAVTVEINCIAELSRQMIDGALIGVHEGMHKIAAYTNDEELFLGFFKQMEKLPENLILDGKNEKSLSIVITCDGSVIDFVNTTYNFGCTKFNSTPYAFLYDEKYHNSFITARNILNINIEFETGICQAGGFVLRFLPKQITEAPTKENLLNILVTYFLLYDISQQTEAYVIIYTGCNQNETQHYLGVCLLADKYQFVQKQIKVPRKLPVEEVSKVVPYIISHYLLNEVLSLNKKKTLVIHPQYDSLSMFLAMVAKDQCQHVYLCCWGEEIASDLQAIIPEVTVIAAQNTNYVLSLTKGRGFDAAIKLLGSDLGKSFLSLANHGHMVLCGKPDLFEDLKLGVFLNNITFKVTEPLNAVISFLSNHESWEEKLMAVISSERFNELWEKDFLKEQSSVYSVLQNSELNKIRLSILIPYLNLKTVALPSPPLSYDDEKFINDVLLNLDHILKKIFSMPPEEDVFEPFQSPEHKSIPTVTLSSPMMAKRDSSTSESSPIKYIKTPKLSMKKSAPCRTLSTSLERISQENESLFVLTPPRNVSSSKIKEFMKAEEVIIPLNSVKTADSPLIIVHPITGVISLLRNFGSMLSVPCYGIQMTELTPRESISEMASFYVQALLAKFPEGPYRLAGYSFGACVALEMALQMQSHLKVELLLMLDGSPKYVNNHCEYIKEEISEITTTKSKEELQEIGYIVSFIEMYKPMDKELRALVYSSLLQLNSNEERIAFLLDYLHGKAVQSPGPARINWLTASFKMSHKTKESPDFVSTTTEVIRATKMKKCINYLKNCKMGENYNPTQKFKGSIHLFRIKKEPEYCLPLPTDYGISEICCDTMVRFYDGKHNTFLNEISLHKDIEKLFQSLKDTQQ